MQRAGFYSGDYLVNHIFAPELHFKDLSSEVADMKNSNLGNPDVRILVDGL